MDLSLHALDITSGKQLKKFYKLWSLSLSSKIKKYAQENSIQWFNIKWKNKSKELPFYIKPTSRNTTGEVWFASSPVNYVFGKGTRKFSDKYRKFPKRMRVKAVHANGRWFTPKKYKPDVKDINTNLAETRGLDRFFVSKTSHHKTHKYKKPMLWGQEKSTKAIFPVFLKEQLSDYIINDPELNKLIEEAFNETIENKKYL